MIINNYGMPFKSFEGDRIYTADDWRFYFGEFFTNGIVGGSLNEMRVAQQETPNKTVLVKTGSIFINGVVKITDAPVTIALEENTSGNPRIDRIVARLNMTDRKIELIVIKGTSAGIPVPPTFIRNSTIWDMSLARVWLENGYNFITDDKITDERSNDNICGYFKTVGQKEFEDENDLLKYDRSVQTSDSYGNPIDIRYTRPHDDSLFLKRVYSNPDASDRYQTITESFYLSDGTTVYKTHTYTLTYLSNGIVDTMTRVVS